MTTPPTSPKTGKKITEWKSVAFLIRTLKRIVLPGFEGMSLYDVTVFFVNGLSKGYITTRASAVSFSFFLAIFPFLIFLFTIIPFVPITNFQQVLLDLIEEFIPHAAWESVRGTLVDIITRPRSGLLILNFFLALIFSTNGINALIDAFNTTSHTFETRTVVKQYLISIVIIFILSLLLIVSIGLMAFGPILLGIFISEERLNSYFFVVMLQSLRWILVITLMIMAISILYFLAPAKRGRYRFISAGSLLATFLVIVTTLGFNYYVDNFSKYNALYGSIGTLLIVLVWIYVNSISLLIGFELNASIINAKLKLRDKH